jgi:TonB family protein
LHARWVLQNIGMMVLPGQRALGRAASAFNADGTLVDAKERDTEARGVSRAGDPVGALAAIDAALALLNEPPLAARTDLEDLRLAAGTMRELTNAQVVAASQAAQADPARAAPTTPTATGATASVPAPAASAGPAAAATTETASTPAVAPTGGATAAARPAASEPVPQPAAATAASPVPAIVPPVAIKQDLPRWNPNDAMARDASDGAIRVQIDAAGRVTGATMERPIHPLFDVLMVEAAKAWRYRPAMRNGQPVPWESVVAIKVAPAAR